MRDLSAVLNQDFLDFLFQQPTWRLWGEERLDGVVYTVYLKKVRYHSPSRSITTVSKLFKKYPSFQIQYFDFHYNFLGCG